MEMDSSSHHSSHQSQSHSQRATTTGGTAMNNNNNNHNYPYYNTTSTWRTAESSHYNTNNDITTASDDNDIDDGNGNDNDNDNDNDNTYKHLTEEDYRLYGMGILHSSSNNNRMRNSNNTNISHSLSSTTHNHNHNSNNTKDLRQEEEHLQMLREQLDAVTNIRRELDKRNETCQIMSQRIHELEPYKEQCIALKTNLNIIEEKLSLHEIYDKENIVKWQQKESNYMHRIMGLENTHQQNESKYMKMSDDLGKQIMTNKDMSERVVGYNNHIVELESEALIMNEKLDALSQDYENQKIIKGKMEENFNRLTIDYEKERILNSELKIAKEERDQLKIELEKANEIIIEYKEDLDQEKMKLESEQITSNTLTREVEGLQGLVSRQEHYIKQVQRDALRARLLHDECEKLQEEIANKNIEIVRLGDILKEEPKKFLDSIESWTDVLSELANMSTKDTDNNNNNDNNNKFSYANDMSEALKITNGIKELTNPENFYMHELFKGLSMSSRSIKLISDKFVQQQGEIRILNKNLMDYEDKNTSVEAENITLITKMESMEKQYNDTKEELNEVVLSAANLDNLAANLKERLQDLQLTTREVNSEINERDLFLERLFDQIKNASHDYNIFDFANTVGGDHHHHHHQHHQSSNNNNNNNNNENNNNENNNNEIKNSSNSNNNNNNNNNNINNNNNNNALGSPYGQSVISMDPSNASPSRPIRYYTLQSNISSGINNIVSAFSNMKDKVGQLSDDVIRKEAEFTASKKAHEEDLQEIRRVYEDQVKDLMNAVKDMEQSITNAKEKVILECEEKLSKMEETVAESAKKLESSQSENASLVESIENLKYELDTTQGKYNSTLFSLLLLARSVRPFYLRCKDLSDQKKFLLKQYLLYHKLSTDTKNLALALSGDYDGTLAEGTNSKLNHTSQSLPVSFRSAVLAIIFRNRLLQAINRPDRNTQFTLNKNCMGISLLSIDRVVLEPNLPSFEEMEAKSDEENFIDLFDILMSDTGDSNIGAGLLGYDLHDPRSLLSRLVLGGRDHLQRLADRELVNEDGDNGDDISFNRVKLLRQTRTKVRYEANEPLFRQHMQNVRRGFLLMGRQLQTFNNEYKEMLEEKENMIKETDTQTMLLEEITQVSESRALEIEEFRARLKLLLEEKSRLIAPEIYEGMQKDLAIKAVVIQEQERYKTENDALRAQLKEVSEEMQVHSTVARRERDIQAEIQSELRDEIGQLRRYAHRSQVEMADLQSHTLKQSFRENSPSSKKWNFDTSKPDLSLYEMSSRSSKGGTSSRQNNSNSNTPNVSINKSYTHQEASSLQKKNELPNELDQKDLEDIIGKLASVEKNSMGTNKNTTKLMDTIKKLVDERIEQDKALQYAKKETDDSYKQIEKIKSEAEESNRYMLGKLKLQQDEVNEVREREKLHGIQSEKRKELLRAHVEAQNDLDSVLKEMKSPLRKGYDQSRETTTTSPQDTSAVSTFSTPKSVKSLENPTKEINGEKPTLMQSPSKSVKERAKAIQSRVTAGFDFNISPSPSFSKSKSKRKEKQAQRK